MANCQGTRNNIEKFPLIVLPPISSSPTGVVVTWWRTLSGGEYERGPPRMCAGPL
jgi:hypothetical protein